jgi:hypothetical protein
MARDSLASNDRMTVDDEFVRETEPKIILKHNKMVNKHSKIGLGYNVMRGTEYSVLL